MGEGADVTYAEAMDLVRAELGGEPVFASHALGSAQAAHDGNCEWFDALVSLASRLRAKRHALAGVRLTVVRT